MTAMKALFNKTPGLTLELEKYRASIFLLKKYCWVKLDNTWSEIKRRH